MPFFLLTLLITQVLSAEIKTSILSQGSSSFLRIHKTTDHWGKVILKFSDVNPAGLENQSYFPVDETVLEIPIPPGRNGKKPVSVEIQHIQIRYRSRTRAGSFGSGPGQLRDPVAIKADPFDHIYVVDAGNDQILKYSRDLRFLNKFGSFNVDSSTSFEDDFSSIEEGGFDEPTDLVAGPNLTFFVADRNNHRLVELDLQGRFVRELISKDSFDEPTSVGMNSRNELGVLDSQNERILFLNSFGQTIYIVGGYGKSREHLQKPLDFIFNNRDELTVLDLGLPAIKVFGENSRFKMESKVDKNPLGISKDPFGYLIIHYQNALVFMTPDLKKVPNLFESRENLTSIIDTTYTSNQHLYALRTEPLEIIEFVPILTIDKKILSFSEPGE